MDIQTPHANAAQIELWNGRGGEIWTRLQTRLDALFTPLTAALLTAAAAKVGESLLDIGCGCGDLTLQAAKALGPGGYIRGIDISAPMLQRARVRETECRAKDSTLAPIDWLKADAMLTHFGPEADLVMSRFGVMFFADPVMAFSRLRQAMKPTGRLAVLCWAPIDQNPWMRVPFEAAKSLTQPLPVLPEGAPGPFAFGDKNRVYDILSKAGFSNVTAQSVETHLILGRSEPNATHPSDSAVEQALIIALETGLVAALLREADTATALAIRDSIAAALRPYFNEDRQEIALAAKCWLYQASPI
jgi:SAM-dependent methyltransferase